MATQESSAFQPLVRGGTRSSDQQAVFDDIVIVERAAATDDALRVGVQGNTTARLLVEADGGLRKEKSVMRAPSAALAGIPTRITADPAPATAATLLGGYIRGSTAAGVFNITTDTAVNIIAAMPGTAAVGDWFDLVIDELPGGAANAITLVGGVGVTVVGTATVTNVSGRFRFVMTAAATMDAVRIDGA